ncbi:MAG: hypothetical protein JWN40_5353 [Phycisphaerales bacterium]|jgi:hypothetical protein|nr:hypothetical protein [Phycisphaerales bacterium]
MLGVLFMLAIFALVIVGMWRVFEKAGKPGWASLVPIYNMMVMAEIAGKPNWYGLLCLIPFVGIVFAIIIVAGVGAAFGKGIGFIIGLLLLGIVFWPILGLGDSQYGGAVREQRGFTPVAPR